MKKLNLVLKLDYCKVREMGSGHILAAVTLGEGVT